MPPWLVDASHTWTVTAWQAPVRVYLRVDYRAVDRSHHGEGDRSGEDELRELHVLVLKMIGDRGVDNVPVRIVIVIDSKF